MKFPNINNYEEFMAYCDKTFMKGECGINCYFLKLCKRKNYAKSGPLGHISSEIILPIIRKKKLEKLLK